MSYYTAGEVKQNNWGGKHVVRFDTGEEYMILDGGEDDEAAVVCSLDYTEFDLYHDAIYSPPDWETAEDDDLSAVEL